MTYKQLFDEAIGEVPPSSVDVDRVVAREGRRARGRRIGAATLAAVAVLAAAVGVGTLRSDRPAPAPANRSAEPLTDQQRVTTAMLAALDHEAPGLFWVTAGDEDPDTWDGPTTTQPVWRVREFSHLSAAGWFGWGVAAHDDVRARVSIEIVETKKAAWTEQDTCERTTLDCTLTHGPDGERIRSIDFQVRMTQPPDGPYSRMIERTVTVSRPDGIVVTVRVRSAEDKSLLTPAELTGVALAVR
ncbi:hypothetical protein [Asanoa iriomotensis]|uniref:Uncharacterized protein n=1 Tax=Asanoa iriomotensis TaxID=234613 RepID=A0ABQ4C834_9ACTN|nr:hypothetical protein [Asanoa iriomotensis]GIF58889.1 hypothetical protein Air01nite_49840 [Asanoa iriomotensis]